MPIRLTLQAAVCGVTPTLGQHAAGLVGERASSPSHDLAIAAHTDFAWKEAVSPHVAVASEGAKSVLAEAAKQASTADVGQLTQ